MTNDQLRERAELAAAFYAGKPVEMKNPVFYSEWEPLSSISPEAWFKEHLHFRVPPTPEQLRLENNARARAEWRAAGHKGLLEARLPASANNWQRATGRSFDNPEFEYRFTPEPAPTVEPWSFETAPDMQKIRRKSDGALYIAVFYPDCVKIGGGDGWNQTIDYPTLLRDFEALDGGICGITKEAK